MLFSSGAFVMPGSSKFMGIVEAKQLNQLNKAPSLKKYHTKQSEKTLYRM